MHNNAEIVTNQNESRNLLETILSCQSSSGGGTGKSKDEIIIDMSMNIQEKVPKIFDYQEIMKQ